MAEAQSFQECIVVEHENEVEVGLTREEAWEILSRCLSSVQEDTPVSETALRKLARSIEVADLSDRLAA